MLGIYAYFDKKDNSVVYVGKDSNIDKNIRDKEHHRPSSYNKQSFNRILQNNPNRYIYQVLVWDVKDQDTLNALEIQHIRQLKPKFNFTNGGDGITGYRHSEEFKRKVSKSMKGENNPFYGRKHSDETKRKISESMRGKNVGENHPRWKTYARVIKGGYKRGKQNYHLIYNGKLIKQSINKQNLEKEANILNGVV